MSRSSLVVRRRRGADDDRLPANGLGGFPWGDLDRQATNLDEADSGRVIEKIPGVVGRERVLVEGEGRFSPYDSRVAFEQLRADDAGDALLDLVLERVTGVIRTKLFKGDSRIVGRKSPFALYEHALATYDTGDLFDHTAAVGFIKICGLPVEIAPRKAPQAVGRQAVVVGATTPTND